MDLSIGPFIIKYESDLGINTVLYEGEELSQYVYEILNEIKPNSPTIEPSSWELQVTDKLVQIAVTVFDNISSLAEEANSSLSVLFADYFFRLFANYYDAPSKKQGMHLKCITVWLRILGLVWDW